MRAEILQKPQYDQMGDCRNFGSDYHPSSQCRKISIGIVVDSSSRKSQAAKEDEAVVLNAERTNSKKENSVERKNKGKAVVDGNAGMQIETSEQVSSPWINTKTPYSENIDIETGFCSQGTSKFPANTGRWNKLGRLKDVPVTHSVHYFANPTSILHAEDGKKKDFVGFTYKRKRGKVEHSQKEQEFTFGTPQEVLVLDKEAKEDRNDNRTETLRLKLQEILGTISSPKSQPSHPQYQELGANNLVAEQVPNQKGNGSVRQNSDTIETDSERTVHAVKRPLTRSLTRKRVASKMRPEKTKRAAPSSSYRQKRKMKGIFSFQGLFGKDNAAVDDDSSLSTRKRSKRKNSGIEPHKICFSKNGNADEILQATHRSATLLPTERTSSVTKKIVSGHSCPSQKKCDSIEHNRNQQKDPLLSPEANPDFSPVANSHKSPGEHYHQSSRKTSHQSSQAHRTEQQQDFNSPAVPENGVPQEDFGYPTVNKLDHQENFQRPTFKIDTPVFSFSPSLTPKTDEIEHGRGSELAEMTFTVGKISSFSTSQFSKADCCPSSADTKLSDEAEEPNSPCRKHSPVETEKIVEDGLSESSSKDGDSDGSEEGSPTFNSLREGNTFSPEAARSERSNFTLYPTKRLQSHEGHVFSKFSPTSPSLKGISVSDWNPEPSEQHHEDELERVTMLFASAIENFKKKLKLATKKKSSEILMTVSEDINLQLKNIESQIQTDLGKLTSDSKSKRKRMETRFQEQQEQLRMINDKFKQGIHQHLQDCKSTFDGLALHQKELKGTLKKQKASHHKLLIQVEEAIEAKLTDAQRRITSVNKLAEEKMLQLRHVVAECLH